MRLTADELIYGLGITTLVAVISYWTYVLIDLFVTWYRTKD